MSLHKNLSPINIHIPYAFQYNDSSDRTGATGFDISDVGKLARQLDNNTLWMLTSTAPTWVAVTGTAGAVTDTTHPSLRQLIHLADGGGPFEGFVTGTYREILPSANPFPTSITWWTSPVKTQKIVEKLITYNSNKTPSTIQWKSYDTDGTTVLATVTDTITYSGVLELSRSRNIT